MKSSRITLKDIAKACGYTANTVSRAMRNDERLPAETRRKIQDAAAGLGYIPNTLASSLRSGRRNTVAIIINDVQNLHFCRLLSWLDPVFHEAGYHMMTLCMRSNGELGEQMIQAAISQAVDGIIYFPNLGDRQKIEYMRQNRMPFVLMDRYVEGVQADLVRCDDERGGFLAMEHLLALGHRRILYLSGPDFSSSQRDRLRGCLKAMAARGIPPEGLRIVPGEPDLANEKIGGHLFPVDYTAVISFRDEIALYALQAYAQRKIRVPEDVSVISFDHLRSEFSYLPKLTSIYAQQNNAAEAAAALLRRRISQISMPVEETILPVRIFDEGSTAPPSGRLSAGPGTGDA